MIIASDVHVPHSRRVRLPSEFFEHGALVVNLEAPIQPAFAVRSKKAGPTLSSDAESLKHDFPAETYFFSANNHIADFGLSGITETDFALGNRLFGVWEQRGCQRATLDIPDEGIRLIATSEFGFLLPTGVSQIDPWSGQVEEEISRAKFCGLEPIVIYHGGLEGTPLPSPVLIERFRRWVDSGAKAVLSHHSHVLSYYEEYKGAVIDYGMGNFIVPFESWKSFHPYSLMSRSWEISRGNMQPRYHKVVDYGPKQKNGEIVVEPLDHLEIETVLRYHEEVQDLVNSDIFEPLLVCVGRAYWRALFRRNLLISIFQQSLASRLRVWAFLSKYIKPLGAEFFQDLVAGESNRYMAIYGTRAELEVNELLCNTAMSLSLVPTAWIPFLRRI